jgi:hypothetical protein
MGLFYSVSIALCCMNCHISALSHRNSYVNKQRYLVKKNVGAIYKKMALYPTALKTMVITHFER